jgi:hypothetical protein
MNMIAASAIGMMILAGSSPGQSAPPAGKTAGETMKNVVVLKDVPATEWQATMVFIGGSLGVRCEYCHAEPYDSDTKKPKVTARRMIQMTREINAKSFGGRPVVTFNTCHQGSTHPKDTPSLWNKTPEQLAAYKKEQAIAAERAKAAAAGQPPPPDAKPAEALPELDQIFANYRKAVGGSSVKSVHMVGAISSDLVSSRALEISAVLPDKFALELTFSGNKSKVALNGLRAWTVTPQGKFDFPPERIAQVRQSMEVAQPLKFMSSDVPRKVVGTEHTGGRSYVIIESKTGKRIERLFFDTQSGLLYKVHIENLTALGPEPSELIFEDYRDMPNINVQHLAAIFIPDGHLTFDAAHDVERFRNPTVRSLREKITLIASDALQEEGGRQSIVSIVSTSGDIRTHRTRHVRGT